MKTALIIDDDINVAEILQIYLEIYNYSVTIF